MMSWNRISALLRADWQQNRKHLLLFCLLFALVVIVVIQFILHTMFLSDITLSDMDGKKYGVIVMVHPTFIAGFFMAAYYLYFFRFINRRVNHSSVPSYELIPARVGEKFASLVIALMFFMLLCWVSIQLAYTLHYLLNWGVIHSCNVPYVWYNPLPGPSTGILPQEYLAMVSMLIGLLFFCGISFRRGIHCLLMLMSIGVLWLLIVGFCQKVLRLPSDGTTILTIMAGIALMVWSYVNLKKRQLR